MPLYYVFLRMVIYHQNVRVCMCMDYLRFYRNIVHFLVYSMKYLRTVSFEFLEQSVFSALLFINPVSVRHVAQ